MGKESTSTFTDKKDEKVQIEDDNLKGVFFRCSFCPCVFLTEADLQKHYSCMGSQSEEHLDYYRRTHARIERGSHTTE